MNTPSHMLIVAAFFARPLAPATLVAAMVGGFVPDLPMFALVLWSTRVMSMPEHDVFGRLYFSDSWQAIFAVDHGLLIWGTLFLAALWGGRVFLRTFAGSGLLHPIADFATHHDDARRQFWPVSDWTFRSPVSYWDQRFYGNVFAAFEIGLAVALAILLCWRLKQAWQRALILAPTALVVVTVILTAGFHGPHGMLMCDKMSARATVEPCVDALTRGCLGRPLSVPASSRSGPCCHCSETWQERVSLGQQPSCPLAECSGHSGHWPLCPRRKLDQMPLAASQAFMSAISGSWAAITSSASLRNSGSLPNSSCTSACTDVERDFSQTAVNPSLTAPSASRQVTRWN